MTITYPYTKHTNRIVEDTLVLDIMNTISEQVAAAYYTRSAAIQYNAE